MVTRKSPIRTCIGCRQRVAADELLRVVVAPDPASGNTLAVVPDPRRRMPGRGAWLHPDPACVELAQRRRAFGRALRVPVTTDPAAVHDGVRQLNSARSARHGSTNTVGSNSAGRDTGGNETGTPAGGTP